MCYFLSKFFFFDVDLCFEQLKTQNQVSHCNDSLILNGKVKQSKLNCNGIMLGTRGTARQTNYSQPEESLVGNDIRPAIINPTGETAGVSS